MARTSSRLKKFYEWARALLDENVLGMGTQHSRLYRFAHFWALVWHSFSRNRCPVRAAALAYGTLLALIPMLAVVVSITSSFLKNQGDERIDEFVMKMVASVIPPATIETNVLASGRSEGLTATNPPADGTNTATGTPAEPGTGASSVDTNQSGFSSHVQAEQGVKARRAIARQIHQLIQNTRSGALGVTGSVLLIFAGISLLGRIEATFNDIWGVARGRNWFMKVVLYWGVLSLVPLLLIVALGLASGPHLAWTHRLVTVMPFVGKIIFGFLPIVVVCLTFGLFYLLMPNTKVDWRAALVGGVAGGLLFHLNNEVSVLYVSRVVSNSRIYGSLGLVPVFMIGVYFSWWILLFGAQVAYAFQNRKAYLEEKQVEQVNQRGREFIALRLMTCIAERFARGEPPAGALEMAEALSVPTRLIQQILQTLGGARLVVETGGGGYVPARPLERITCHDILLALRAGQGQDLATRDEPARREIYGEYQRIEEAERQAAATVTMRALVERAQAREIRLTHDN
jgi:membrane protein